MRRVLCRLGFHRWVEIKKTDPDLDKPSQQAEWLIKCRHCGREKGEGMRFALSLSVAAMVGSAAVFWFLSPLLGAIMMIGAFGALGSTMLPMSLGRMVRWLSVGR